MEDAPNIDPEPADTTTYSASHSFLLARLSRWHRTPSAADCGTGDYPTRKAIDAAIVLVRQFAAEGTQIRYLTPADKHGIDVSVPGDVVHRIDKRGVVDVVTFAGHETE